MTYEDCIDDIENKGNSALLTLMERQSVKNSPSPEERAKIIQQYKDFKTFSFEVLNDINMNKQKREIKEYSVTVSAICLTCHRRYPTDKIQKHVNEIHKGEDTSFCEMKSKF